jgi:beta-lactamase superfamily II metal-dependent hydrolase
MSDGVPPKRDELEVSVIGPGRGESVIVHLGDDDWCIVDSCIARGATLPAAAVYLREYGANTLSRVKLILATHWHDDHIRGLSQLLSLCPNARFSCSAALDSDTFRTLVGTADTSLPGKSGVDEFAAIFDLMLERQDGGIPANLVAPAFAIESRRLLHLIDEARAFPVAVMALSPSDGSVKLAYTEIAATLPKAGQAQRRIPNRSPNHTSVVLWIEAVNRRVLLGADLEHTNKPGEGWMAVLASHTDTTPAAVFKVGHHGSANADCPEVWTKMLAEQPIAVLTPFTGGKVRLPKESDVQRLSERTSRLYCTARGAGQPPPRDSAVEKTLRQFVSERRVVDGRAGHVRIRWSVADDAQPTVDLFDGAYAV